MRIPVKGQGARSNGRILRTGCTTIRAFKVAFTVTSECSSIAYSIDTSWAANCGEIIQATSTYIKLYNYGKMNKTEKGQDNILGVLQSVPSKLSAQSQVNVVVLHTPLTHVGLQTVEKQFKGNNNIEQDIQYIE